MCKSIKIFFIGLKKDLLGLVWKVRLYRRHSKRNQLIKNHYDDNYSASIYAMHALFRFCILLTFVISFLIFFLNAFIFATSQKTNHGSNDAPRNGQTWKIGCHHRTKNGSVPKPRVRIVRIFNKDFWSRDLNISWSTGFLAERPLTIRRFAPVSKIQNRRNALSKCSW